MNINLTSKQACLIRLVLEDKLLSYRTEIKKKDVYSQDSIDYMNSVISLGSDILSLLEKR